MLKKDMPSGVVLYEGPSRIDGEPIAAILTGFKDGDNKKTGNTLQVWIMRSDIHPHDAKKEGKDFSICGDCVHRKEYWETCYVNLIRGPISTYHRYKSLHYPKMDKKYFELLKGRIIRWGAYGDPCAIPLKIIKKYTDMSKGATGYTQQWNTNKNKGYQEYLMASVKSTLGYYDWYYKAQKRGWRTFRTTTPDDFVILENESPCFASKERGELTTCVNCFACNGLSSDKKSKVTFMHGSPAQIQRFIDGTKAMKNKRKYKKKLKKPSSKVKLVAA